MPLSDDQIRELLDWLVTKSELRKKWTEGRQKGLDEHHQWIQPNVIAALPDNELEEKFIKYYKSGTGNRQNINQLNRDRIVRDKKKFREMLLFLLNETINVEQRINDVLGGGKYHIEGVGKALATAMLMDFMPEKYCLWNNKTELGLSVLGWQIFSRGDSLGTSYLKVLNALERIRKLTPEANLSFLDVDLFLHVISAEDEGKKAVEEVKGKTGYLILHFAESSAWDDKMGESYHYGTTVPNYTKIQAGSTFVLFQKKVGFIGHGVVASVEPEESSTTDSKIFRAKFQSFQKIVPPKEMTEGIRQKIAALPNYNPQHSIKVINKEIYDLILYEGIETKASTWIFQANPEIYDLEASLKVLKEQKWQVNQHRDKLGTGDTVYLWLAGKSAGIRAVAEVISEVEDMPDDEEAQPFIRSTDKLGGISPRVMLRITKVLEKPIAKAFLLGHKTLSDLIILKQPYQTNYTVTKEQADALRALLENNEVPSYSKAQALAGLFLDEEEFDYIIDRIKAKKNVILQGPPGVGKTFIAKRLAFATMGEKDESRVAMIQFHQSYSYEDFIQGFRPNEQGKFDLRNGLFYEFCIRAQNDDLGRPYVFIIDEINRGNLSKILGELMMLIEPDKRGPDFAIPLTYSATTQQKFYIPENLHIIGMMNTADRSIALLDTALRRRFGFIELMPDVNVLGNAVVESIPLGPWLSALNCKICENIGRDARNLQVGHSYLLENGQPISSFSKFVRVIQDDIIPLIEEYCYDDYDTMNKILGKSFVDEINQRINTDLFDPAKKDDLIQALKSIDPNLDSSAPALLSDAEMHEEHQGGQPDDSEHAADES